MVSLLLLSVLPALAFDTCTVTIEANSEADGILRYRIYLPEHASHFPSVEPGQTLKNGVARLEGGVISVRLEGLAPGVYAVSAFVDQDSDGVLDKNMFGAPSEPWAVSNNVRNAMSAPTFDQASFTVVAGKSHRVSLDLR